VRGDVGVSLATLIALRKELGREPTTEEIVAAVYDQFRAGYALKAVRDLGLDRGAL
jgi:hypothetical protein